MAPRSVKCTGIVILSMTTLGGDRSADTGRSGSTSANVYRIAALHRTIKASSISSAFESSGSRWRIKTFLNRCGNHVDSCASDEASAAAENLRCRARPSKYRHLCNRKNTAPTISAAHRAQTVEIKSHRICLLVSSMKAR